MNLIIFGKTFDIKIMTFFPQRKAAFWGEEKTRATGVPRGKPLGERERKSNKQIYICLLIDHLQIPCPEPRSQWIKLSMELLTHLP